MFELNRAATTATDAVSGTRKEVAGGIAVLTGIYGSRANRIAQLKDAIQFSLAPAAMPGRAM